ncbi:MAG: BON domain-containing protein [Saccharospirillum sp.]|nr:BON domain-containing protein [Saccharospirillum sp.]
MKLINTIWVSLFSILLITTTVAGCAGSATQESTGEYIDDTWITTKVKAALIADPVAKARDVKVETFKGAVQLSGFVDSREAMDQAINVALGIEGVRTVENKMTIK